MSAAPDPAASGGPVRVRVPAKINLSLSVGPLRPDGFHELTTVFQAVSLHDEVVAHRADGLHVRVHGDGADILPTGRQNLAGRAADLLARHSHVPADVLLEVHKRIPIAGGMAGGSADAAAALLACARLWRTGSSDADLIALAAELGSDVAFPLLGGTALGTGRGERLSPVPVSASFHWVIATSDYGIAAGDAYRELDRLRAVGDAGPPRESPEALIAALRDGDPDGVARALGNDLQAAALSLRPELGAVLAAGLGLGALAGLVSGSGPTCAFLCRDAAAATALAADLATSCRAAFPVTAPAPGAQVVDP